MKRRNDETAISSLYARVVVVQCYEEAGMWRDALRVCQRHLPHLAHKVQTQYQVRRADAVVALGKAGVTRKGMGGAGSNVGGDIMCAGRDFYHISPTVYIRSITCDDLGTGPVQISTRVLPGKKMLTIVPRWKIRHVP